MEDGWQPIETAPKHQEILLFRPDAGVLFGMWTYCAEWVADNDEEYDEETLFKMDFWAFDHFGACRLEREATPTHWRPLPAPPVTTET